MLKVESRALNVRQSTKSPSPQPSPGVPDEGVNAGCSIPSSALARPSIQRRLAGALSSSGCANISLAALFVPRRKRQALTGLTLALNTSYDRMADDRVQLAATGSSSPARHDRHQAGGGRAWSLPEDHGVRQRNRFDRAVRSHGRTCSGGVELQEELREDQRHDGSHLRRHQSDHAAREHDCRQRELHHDVAPGGRAEGESDSGVGKSAIDVVGGSG